MFTVIRHESVLGGGFRDHSQRTKLWAGSAEQANEGYASARQGDAIRMEPPPPVDRAQIEALIEQARALESRPQEPPGETLALAALWRCAHLLEQMQQAAVAGLDELVALALRPLLETAVFGLHYLLASDAEEWRRAGVEDARERWQMASRIAEEVDRDPEEIKAQEATFASEGDEATGRKLRGARDLNQMAELIDRHRQATPEGMYTQAWRWLFGSLSDKHLHGGAGALERYTDVTDPAHLRPVFTPQPLMAIVDLLACGYALMGPLYEELERARGLEE